MVLSAFGVIRAEAELAALARTDEFGTAIGNLVAAARFLGFDCEASVFDLPSLSGTRFPIVYLDGPTLGRAYLMHAVVVAELAQGVRVLDPVRGEMDLPKDQFSEAWEAAGSYAIVVRQKHGE